ncbi:TIR domain-containing protein [Reichenbachiella sp.]|uniref:TIR domain-containing protein n=1 Tax=Reichenbachiella sp. TaxID=2184521 RepID=UPI003299833E
MTWSGIRRRVFISHYREDRSEVDSFINTFANDEGVFFPYVLGANNNDDFINSTNTDYVMSQIRNRYLQDSTVTIVLIGSCTHSRRYVDWEIKSSLRQGLYTPNGLLGILLPNQGINGLLPQRFAQNWEHGHSNCYARFEYYPTSGYQLGEQIDDAFQARTTRNHLIVNSQDMMRYNSKCIAHNITH